MTNQYGPPPGPQNPYGYGPQQGLPPQPPPQDPFSHYYGAPRGAPLPAAPPGQPQRPAAAKKAAKKGSTWAGCITLLVIAGIIAIIIAVATSGPSAAYRATATNFMPLNPATLDVTVRVTNTGQASGTPTCTIEASDAGNSYIGTDVATLQGSLAPGQSSVFTDQFTITHQGAAFITNVTVSCS